MATQKCLADSNKRLTRLSGHQEVNFFYQTGLLLIANWIVANHYPSYHKEQKDFKQVIQWRRISNSVLGYWFLNRGIED